MEEGTKSKAKSKKRARRCFRRKANARNGTQPGKDEKKKAVEEER